MSGLQRGKLAEVVRLKTTIGVRQLRRERHHAIPPCGCVPTHRTAPFLRVESLRACQTDLHLPPPTTPRLTPAPSVQPLVIGTIILVQTRHHVGVPAEQLLGPRRKVRRISRPMVIGSPSVFSRNSQPHPGLPVPVAVIQHVPRPAVVEHERVGDHLRIPAGRRHGNPRFIVFPCPANPVL